MTTQTLYPDINPSLLLDFANLKKLDPRITFTRASTATYYDGKTWAKAEENLLLNSQDYSATWVATNLTPVTGKTAPDGTSTATEFTASAANGTLTQSVTAVAGDYTFSVWLRRVTGTGDVEISAHSGGTWVVKTLTADWTRFDVTQTLTAGARTPGIRVTTNADAIEVWGAQLELRSAVTAYTPTTTQPITNYIPALQTAASGVARFDHDPVTGESLGLLIEEQRANLLTYSEDFNNAAWTKTQSSITNNTTAAPDGTLTGDNLVENAANNFHYTSPNPTTASQSFVSGVAYTITVFAKETLTGAKRFLQVTFSSGPFPSLPCANFDLATGAISTQAGGVSRVASIESVGNGWYRCRLSANAEVTTSSVGAFFLLQSSGTASRFASYQGDGYSGICIWGAQLEEGAFPTSYIKTEASQVTRSADAASMTGTNFSSWYRQDEGGLFVSGASPASGTRALAAADNNTSGEQVRLFTSTLDPKSIVTDSGVTQADLDAGTIAARTAFKLALACKANDFALSCAGGAVVTDNSGTLPTVDRLRIGTDQAGNTLNGHIRKFAYYPKRLTNAQLQALTR